MLNDTPLAQQTTSVRDGHGAGLMPLVEAVFADAGIAPSSLDGVAVAIGPGTFTGLRVGLATAKGIATAHALPLVGISSLAALAHGVTAEGLVVPMFDARRDEIYGAAFDGDQSIIEEQVCTPQAFAQQLVQLSRPCVCLGEGLLRYRAIFEAMLGDQCVSVDHNLHTPKAVHVASLAAKRFAKGDHDDLAALVPQYLRGSYADT